MGTHRPRNGSCFSVMEEVKHVHMLCGKESLTLEKNIKDEERMKKRIKLKEREEILTEQRPKEEKGR